MKRALTCLGLFLAALQSGRAHAEPFVLSLVVDPQAVSGAGKIRKFLLANEPFKDLAAAGGMKIQVVVADRRLMDCSSDGRWLSCDNAYVGCIGRQGIWKPEGRVCTGQSRDVHAVAVVSSLKKYGAAGGPKGSIAKITLGLDRPERHLLHELFHVLAGLRDEYVEKDPKVLRNKCQILPEGAAFPNQVALRPRGSYQSEKEALSLHGQQIPWIQSVQAPTTSLHNGLRKLGSPRTGPSRSKVGLFELQDCGSGITLYKTYLKPTIMSDYWKQKKVLVPEYYSAVMLDALKELVEKP